MPEGSALEGVTAGGEGRVGSTIGGVAAGGGLSLRGRPTGPSATAMCLGFGIRGRAV